MDDLIKKKLSEVQKALEDLSLDLLSQKEILDLINKKLESRNNLVVDNDESVVTGCGLSSKVNEYVGSSVLDPSVPDTDSCSESENRDRNINCDEDKNKKEALDYYKSKIENSFKDYINKYKNVEYVYYYSDVDITDDEDEDYDDEEEKEEDYYLKDRKEVDDGKDEEEVLYDDDDDDFVNDKDKYDKINKENRQIIQKLKKDMIDIKDFLFYRMLFKSILKLTNLKNNLEKFLKTEEGKKLLNEVELNFLILKFYENLIYFFEEFLIRVIEEKKLRNLILENKHLTFIGLDNSFIIEGTNDNKNTEEEKKLLSVEEFKSMVDEYVNNLKLTEKNVLMIIDKGKKLKELLVGIKNYRNKSSENESKNETNDIEQETNENIKNNISKINDKLNIANIKKLLDCKKIIYKVGFSGKELNSHLSEIQNRIKNEIKLIDEYMKEYNILNDEVKNNPNDKEKQQKLKELENKIDKLFKETMNDFNEEVKLFHSYYFNDHDELKCLKNQKLL